MNQDIVIASSYNLTAISKKSNIYRIITPNLEYRIGDIYYGVTYKIFPSINAAFIYLDKYNSHYKSGFIHINDLRYLKTSKFLSKFLTNNGKLIES
jgi:hypothetical protein